MNPSRKRKKLDVVEDELKAKLGALSGPSSQTLIVTCLGVDDNDTVTSTTTSVCMGLLLEYASWNKFCMTHVPSSTELLTRAARKAFAGLDGTIFYACIQVDENDDTVGHCIGDVEDHDSFSRPSPPGGSLPAVSLVLIDMNSASAIQDWRYVPHITSMDLELVLARRDETPGTLSNGDISLLEASFHRTIKESADGLANHFHLGVSKSASAAALRIFVAGDRSSVGKSSVCLGLLGNLIQSGYSPESLAYIKPATQSESTQLVQLYCDSRGIECVSVGPLVYYRGFTRAFLAGETETTEGLLEKVGRAVDRVARGKRVVLVDGVGFPAVGSICGTDNASVAKACSYPSTDDITERKPMGVVLVGGSGVGGAVDAFNLNANYFEQANVPVLGAVFNKLSLDGYYSLENCKKQVTAYFNASERQKTLGRRPFGFVPLFPAIAGSEPMKHVDEYIRLFGEHVDVASIIQYAEAIQHNIAVAPTVQNGETAARKRQRVDTLLKRDQRSRQEIETTAIDAGAAPSA